MRKIVETMAASIARRPHSFEKIRKTTGLRLTDEQFMEMVKKDRHRFKLVRFVKRDAKGVPIHPGRPGVGLKVATA